MIDTVHTYYEPVRGIDAECQMKEIAIWEQSWRRLGWKTRVLGRDDVQIAPAELERLRRLPSVNPEGYDLACYLRWFAMRALGGGFLVDYDVVNLRARPGIHEAILWGQSTIRILAGGRVPCAVFLVDGGGRSMCDILLGYEPSPSDLFEGRPHVSDMTILQASVSNQIAEYPLCKEPQLMDVGTVALHVSHNAMVAMGVNDWHRHDVMKVLSSLGSALTR